MPTDPAMLRSPPVGGSRPKSDLLPRRGARLCYVENYSVENTSIGIVADQYFVPPSAGWVTPTLMSSTREDATAPPNVGCEWIAPRTELPGVMSPYNWA